nr:hypothetical protein [Planctomycetota bacterium]
AQQEIQVGFGSSSQHAVALLDSTFEHSAVQVGKIKAEGSSRVISPTIPHLALALVSPFNLGALAWFTVGGEPQRACVVVVSHGWNPIDFPFGTFFPDGRGWFHSVSAVLDANGRAAILTAVGRDPVSLGQVLTCQAVEISPTLELRLSTPLAGIVSVPPF